MLSYQTQLYIYFPSDGNYLWFLLWGIKSSFHMSVGAEQAREVVTLVTSEAPFSILWVET